MHSELILGIRIDNPILCQQLQKLQQQLNLPNAKKALDSGLIMPFIKLHPDCNIQKVFYRLRQVVTPYIELKLKGFNINRSYAQNIRGISIATILPDHIEKLRASLLEELYQQGLCPAQKLTYEVPWLTGKRLNEEEVLGFCAFMSAFDFGNYCFEHLSIYEIQNGQAIEIQDSFYTFNLEEDDWIAQFA